MQEPTIGKIEMLEERTAPGVVELKRQLDAHLEWHKIADKNADKHTEALDNLLDRDTVARVEAMTDEVLGYYAANRAKHKFQQEVIDDND